MNAEQHRGLEGSLSKPIRGDDHGIEQQSGSMDQRHMESILRIPVVVQVVVGSATLPISSLLKLGRGAIVPLDHRIGDPVDVVVNGRVIARGEVVVVEGDNTRFGVSLTEIKDRQIGVARD